jgi:hypothetical protein
MTEPFSTAKQAQENAQQAEEQLVRPQLTSQPSGIAQLRKTSEANANNIPSDPMNLDDFLVPTSMGSPAGLPTPSSTETSGPVHQANIQANGIPINTKQKPNVQTSNVPAASVPKSAGPVQHAGFDGIPKRVRKTSIDERRSVSNSSPLSSLCTTDRDLESKASRGLLSTSTPIDRAKQWKSRPEPTCSRLQLERHQWSDIPEPE